MNLQQFEERILQSFESSREFNSNDLGGVEYLFDNIAIVSTSRFLPEILIVIINACQGSTVNSPFLINHLHC